MQDTREEFHKFIDQVPPHRLTADVLWRLKALLAATERATSPSVAGGSTGDQSAHSLGEISRLAADLQMLLAQIGEFDLTSVEIRERLASIQRHVAELAVDLAESAHKLVFLNAPDDDEEETEDEVVAVADARKDIRAGHTRPWAEIRQELEAKANDA